MATFLVIPYDSEDSKGPRGLRLDRARVMENEAASVQPKDLIERAADGPGFFVSIRIDNADKRMVRHTFTAEPTP